MQMMFLHACSSRGWKPLPPCEEKMNKLYFGDNLEILRVTVGMTVSAV